MEPSLQEAAQPRKGTHGNHRDGGFRFRRLRLRARYGGSRGHSVHQLQPQAQLHGRRDHRPRRRRRRGHHILRALHRRGDRGTAVTEGDQQDGHRRGQHRHRRSHRQRHRGVQRARLRHRSSLRPRHRPGLGRAAAHQRAGCRHARRRVEFPLAPALRAGDRAHVRRGGLRPHRSGHRGQGGSASSYGTVAARPAPSPPRAFPAWAWTICCAPPTWSASTRRSPPRPATC